MSSNGTENRVKAAWVRGPLVVVAEVTPRAAAELRLADGGPVRVTIKATEIEVYPE